MAEIKKIVELCIRSSKLKELVLNLLRDNDYSWVEEGNPNILPFRIEVYERVNE